MKALKSIIVLSLTLLLSGVLYSQNITNTLGTGGTFTIKDGSTNYFTLSQSTGNVSLFRNLELGGLENSTSTRGVITKDGIRFIHNYQAPGTAGQNTFIGLEAGNFTMSGINHEASYNTGVGYRSLYSLTTGYYNSAFGSLALYSNTTGNSNSAFGNGALYSNTTGNSNSAFGNGALYFNTTGNDNCAFGHRSLYFNSSGNNNVAIGSNAGYYISGSNNIAIGYDAQVPNNTGSNQIRLGNSSITYAGVQVSWTVTSDRRYKDNIAPIGLGLGFISKLNPVSCQRKNDENKKTEYGLIAQEVEQVLKDLGIDNHAMLTITDEGMYELRYNDLIAPMIKAIQELKEKSDTKDKEIASLRQEKEAEITKLMKENEEEERYITLLELEFNRIKQILDEIIVKEENIKVVNLSE